VTDDKIKIILVQLCSISYMPNVFAVSPFYEVSIIFCGVLSLHDYCSKSH